MVAKGKLEQLGGKAQKEAIKLSVEGLSHGAIADKLNEKYNSDLSADTVRFFLKRNKNKTFQILKEDKNFQNKMVKQYFDTLTQLNQLNAEMWKFFYEIRRDPEHSSKQIFCPKCNHKFRVQLKSFGTLLKTSEILLKQIEHVDKVLGKMKDNNLTINYSYTDMSKKLQMIFPELANEMAKQGIIKIIKKKKLREINL